MKVRHSKYMSVVKFQRLATEQEIYDT